MEFLTTPSGQIYSKSPAFTHCQMSDSIEPIWISSLNWIAEIDSRIASVMQPVFRLIGFPTIKMLLILFRRSGVMKTFRCSRQKFFRTPQKYPAMESTHPIDWQSYLPKPQASSTIRNYTLPEVSRRPFKLAAKRVRQLGEWVTTQQQPTLTGKHYTW